MASWHTAYQFCAHFLLAAILYKVVAALGQFPTGIAGRCEPGGESPHPYSCFPFRNLWFSPLRQFARWFLCYSNCVPLRTAVQSAVHGHSLADETMIGHRLISGFKRRNHRRWRMAIHLVHPGHDTLPGCSDPVACMYCSCKYCRDFSASRFQ